MRQQTIITILRQTLESIRTFLQTLSLRLWEWIWL